MAARHTQKYLSHMHTSATQLRATRVPLAFELHRPQHAGSRQLDPANRSPVILLHGFLGSKRENRRVSKFLAQDLSRQVFCLDLRNHGDSAHHPTHNYMEMALDVELFVRSHRLVRPILIGHSMGAKTALTLALHLPDLISKVIAVDNGPVHLPLSEDFPRYLKGMAEIKNAQVKTHLEADMILRNYAESLAVRLWLLSNFIQDRNSLQLKSRVPLDILEKAIGPLGEFPHKNMPVAFQKPTLFLRALRSQYIPEVSLPIISSFFPLSRIVNMDCGHWIIQERPMEFRRAVVEFLQENA